MINSEDSLLEQSKKLNPIALQMLHQKYYGSVARYIQSRVGDLKAVEDLSGEVFVRMLESLQRGYGWKNSPQSWIMGITRNVVADYYRQKGRTVEVELSDLISAPEEAQPTHQVFVNERNQIIWDAIQQLTDDQRDVVILRFMAGANIKETAEILSKSHGAVKALQHRALRTLAARISVLKHESR